MPRSPCTSSALPTPGSWPPALACQKVYLIFEPRAALETDLETAKGISVAVVMRGQGEGRRPGRDQRRRLSDLLGAVPALTLRL